MYSNRNDIVNFIYLCGLFPLRLKTKSTVKQMVLYISKLTSQTGQTGNVANRLKQIKQDSLLIMSLKSIFKN